MDAAAPTLERLAPARQDRGFYCGLTIAFLLTAVVGFGPTYFFKPVHPSPPLSPLVHAHGLVFTGWLVLLIVQTALVKAHRVDLHKRLGIAGAALAALMVPLGIMVAIEGARHGTTTKGFEPLGFTIFPIGAVVMFTGFVGVALWKRRQPEIHRRLIVLGTVSILTPAIVRLWFLPRNPILALLLSLLFVLAAMLHDWKTRRRVHPLYLWGGVFIFLSGPLRSAIGHSAAWESIARFLVE